MAPSSPPTGKNNRVVVIGGGYAGVAAARAAEKSSPDVEVTLVTSRELFLHYISGLRASVNSSWKERTLIPYDGVLARGTVISGATVTGLNAVERTISTDTGISVAYDYLILATGYLSNKTAGGVGNAVHASDMKGAYAFRMEKIKAAERILVAGGGPVGVEMAGEIAWTFPEKKITLVSSKDLMESKVYVVHICSILCLASVFRSHPHSLSSALHFVTLSSDPCRLIWSPWA
jgi:NADH dehydrogenase FAD-containing subunit